MRYAERLKNSSDGGQVVEKFMKAKARVSKSQVINFHPEEIEDSEEDISEQEEIQEIEHEDQYIETEEEEKENRSDVMNNILNYDIQESSPSASPPQETQESNTDKYFSEIKEEFKPDNRKKRNKAKNNFNSVKGYEKLERKKAFEYSQKIDKISSEKNINKFNGMIGEYTEGGKVNSNAINHTTYLENPKYKLNHGSGTSNYYRKAYVGQDYANDDEITQEEPIHDHYQHSFKNSLQNGNSNLHRMNKI